VVGQWLRLIDPATGEPVPMPEEDHEGGLAAHRARLAAEERARREAEARQGAEAALEAALAEIAHLRGAEPG
jgi:hypothetical protein